MQNSGSQALADAIVDLAKKRRLSVPFGVADLRPHFGGYAESHIMTVLANYEVNGDQVRRGRAARFLRVSRGKYKPI